MNAVISETNGKVERQDERMERLNQQSVDNVRGTGAPIVIQDNSVNSSQQSNVSNNASAPAPMRSPVNNNRTRAN